MGIVVIGAVFVDVKGYPDYAYIPAGRNAGRVEYVHGGVGRNVAEDIANVVSHLCAPGAYRYTTGDVIDVDGGFHIRRL